MIDKLCNKQVQSINEHYDESLYLDLMAHVHQISITKK